MTHLTFDQISELADNGHPPLAGARPAAESAEARHLAECAACRETLRRVRELVAAAHALPRDIAAPPEVWTALRTRVARDAASRRPARRWRGGWIAAAAAIVLFVGTAILMPRTATTGKGSKLPRPTSAAVTPVALTNVDRSYSATLVELRESLDAQRHVLAPSTVRIVERSLATIDTAIAEARAALASDPANQALVEILSAQYERKVELLQRATALSSSS